MSIADKLIQITENLKKIYDKGYQDGYAAGSGSMGEDTYNYTCPNCGEIFYTEGPPYCPSCGANHDEWYEGMPSYTCSNCGQIFYAESSSYCPLCGYEEWQGPVYTCIWCGTEIEAFQDENGMICCSVGCGRDVYVDDTLESGWEGPSGYCPNCEKQINTTDNNCHYCGTTLQ